MPVVQQTTKSEFVFQAGVFQTFKTLNEIHLGKFTLDLAKNSIVEFDGQIMKHEGKEYSYPEFRAGIRAGWVVPVGSSAQAPSKPSEVKVRPAVDRSGGRKAERIVPTTVANEEQYVESDRLRRVVQKDDSEEGVKVASIRSREVVSEDSMQNVGSALASKRAMKVEVEGAESDEAVSIGKIGSKAVQKVTVSDASAASRQARELDESSRKAPILLPSKKGTDIHAAEAEKVEDLLDTIEPEDRPKAIAKASVSKSEEAAEIARRRREAAEKSALAAGATPEQIKATKRVDPVKPVTSKTSATPTKVAAEKNASKPPVKIRAPQTIEEVVLAGDTIDLGDGLTWDKKIHWLQRAKLAADLYEKSGEEQFERVLSIEVESVQKFARKILAERLAKKA